MSPSPRKHICTDSSTVRTTQLVARALKPMDGLNQVQKLLGSFKFLQDSPRGLGIWEHSS